MIVGVSSVPEAFVTTVDQYEIMIALGKFSKNDTQKKSLSIKKSTKLCSIRVACSRWKQNRGLNDG